MCKLNKLIYKCQNSSTQQRVGKINFLKGEIKNDKIKIKKDD